MHGEWLQWYYLIFLLPAAIAMLVLLMAGFGGHHGSHHGAGTAGAHFHGHGFHLHGHHAGAHAGHAHAGGHSGAGHGHSTGHGAAGHHADGHGHPATPHGHNGPSAGRQLLGFFGVGRAPITIVIGSLMIGWGVCGFIAVEVLRPLLVHPALFMLPALLVASAGALVTAKLFGELAARMMPREETSVITRDGLVGLTGKVVYRVSKSEGRVHAFDPFHTLHAESARVAAGAEPVEKGTEVIVVSVEPEGRFIMVEPLGIAVREA